MDSPQEKPMELLREQTTLLKGIHDELVWARQKQEREKLFHIALYIGKILVIVGTGWFIQMTVESYISSLQNSLPSLPKVDIQKYNPFK